LLSKIQIKILMFDVAVIGAGMAGLTCAQQLQQLGYQVVVLEKSRGVGGRVATRRLPGTRADHGARFLEPKTELVRQLVMMLSKYHIVQPWTDRFYQFNPDNQELIPASNWCPYYIAPEGISAVGKFLATGLNIWFNRRVQQIQPNHQNDHWRITLEATTELESQEVTARTIVLAIPAPQALILLANQETGISSEVLDKVRSVEFDPCIAVMAGYAAEKQQELAQQDLAQQDLAQQDLAQQDLAQQTPIWRGLLFPPGDCLSWVAWDSSKRKAATQPVFVLHSSAEFAQNYLDATDLQPAADRLLARAAEWSIPWLNAPEWMQVHRWRYGLCRRPLAESILSINRPLPLVCAGDWCGGNQIEGALASGFEAARWVNERSRNVPLPPLASFWQRINPSLESN
jgi:renalase